MRLVECRAVLLAAGLMLPLTAEPAAAACDMPDTAPVDIAAGAVDDGARLHIVSGIVGLCDTSLREFDLDLPELHDIRNPQVRLTLGGFTRRYGVHQISFVLQGETAEPTPTGVKIRFTAAVDGIDRYQLAYTLYVTVKP